MESVLEGQVDLFELFSSTFLIYLKSSHEFLRINLNEGDEKHLVTGMIIIIKNDEDDNVCSLFDKVNGKLICQGEISLSLLKAC